MRASSGSVSPVVDLSCLYHHHHVPFLRHRRDLASKITSCERKGGAGAGVAGAQLSDELAAGAYERWRALLPSQTTLVNALGVAAKEWDACRKIELEWSEHPIDVFFMAGLAGEAGQVSRASAPRCRCPRVFTVEPAATVVHG